MTQYTNMNFLPTGIGSLPYLNPREAVETVLSHFNEIPFWPQLPKKSFKESMYAQFSEKMPAVILEESDSKIYFDTSKDYIAELENVYEKYLADDTDYFEISAEYAAGLYEFLKVIEERAQSREYIKCHIIGPISFGLSVSDQNKKSILYNEELFDGILKTLLMKAKWQIRCFKKFAEKIIVFLDEPYLVSIGSAFASLKKEDVILKLNEIVDAIHNEGAIAGIHCCGNTDWSLLMETHTDIISFDAYNFSESLALYPKETKLFLSKGGVIGWGIVPTAAEELSGIGAGELTDRLKKKIEILQNKGVERELIMRQALLTPACGLGLLTPELAEKAFGLTKEVSGKIIRG